MKSTPEESGGRGMTEQQAATLGMLRKTAANGFALTLTATQICQVLELCESGWQRTGISDDQIATLMADNAAVRKVLEKALKEEYCNDSAECHTQWHDDARRVLYPLASRRGGAGLAN